jgi:hypothetical protein
VEPLASEQVEMISSSLQQPLPQVDHLFSKKKMHNTQQSLTNSRIPMTQSAIADRSWVTFYLLQKTWDSIVLISLNSHTTQLM